MIELKGPSVAEIKNFIKEKNIVEFHLVNNKILAGQILWHDDNTFHLQIENNKRLTLLKHVIIYYSKIN